MADVPEHLVEKALVAVHKDPGFFWGVTVGVVPEKVHDFERDIIRTVLSAVLPEYRVQVAREARAVAEHLGQDGVAWRIHDELIGDITTIEVTTRHPEDYELVNHEDGSRWVIDNGHWKRKENDADQRT